jgi:uncharacterized membrane protein YqjE
MEKNLIARIGTFFILIGLALLVIFVGSIMSKDINGIYLLLSLSAIFVGWLLRRNKPVNESGRFGTIRRASERNRQRGEERMNNKQKK